jgi:hypothetical protein
MTEAELIREVFPRHSMKLLARLLDVPIDTARHLLYRKFSAARRRELALKLLRDLDEQETKRMGVRRQLQEIVNDGEPGEMESALAGSPAGETRLSRAARRLAREAADLPPMAAVPLLDVAGTEEVAEGEPQ